MPVVNKGRKLIAALLAAALFACLFPAVCAEETGAEVPAEDVTYFAEYTSDDVTEVVSDPAESPEAEPAEEPAGETVPGEEENPPAEDGDPADEDEDEPEFYEFDDDDPGTVSAELLEQFNNPEVYEHVEFNGTADILLKEDSFSYGQTVTLLARVSGVEMSYRLVWEANDHDDRGWFMIASGPEYSFVVTPENIDREYRVIIFAVD